MLTKLGKTHFSKFVQLCESFLDKYKLGTWDVVYDFNLLEEGRYAQNIINFINGTAQITLNSGEVNILTDEDTYLRETAKHEILHILVGTLGGMAQSRFLSEDELTSAEEKLVVHLCKLL